MVTPRWKCGYAEGSTPSPSTMDVDICDMAAKLFANVVLYAVDKIF